MNTYTHLGLDDAIDELRRVVELEKARREIEQGADAPPISKKAFKMT